MQIPPDREWTAFTMREPSLLKPDHKPRDPETATFPFDDHALTKPVIEGNLARKSNILKYPPNPLPCNPLPTTPVPCLLATSLLLAACLLRGIKLTPRRRQSAYYVLTPSGFLLEYKDPSPISHPDPTLSIKLRDSELGNPPSRSGKAGFTIRGKDAGKSFGGMNHEYIFRTDSMQQATLWWTKLEKFMGNAPRGEDTAAQLTESEDEAGETGKVRAEPGQGVRQQQPVQTAAPTAAATRGTSQGGSTTTAPAPTAGVTPTATTGVAAPTATPGPTTTTTTGA